MRRTECDDLIVVGINRTGADKGRQLGLIAQEKAEDGELAVDVNRPKPCAQAIVDNPLLEPGVLMRTRRGAANEANQRRSNAELR